MLGMQFCNPWDLLIWLARFSCGQLGVFDSVALDERANSREALQSFCWFEVQSYNLKPQKVILAVEFFEKRGLPVAVWAPTSDYIDEL